VPPASPERMQSLDTRILTNIREYAILQKDNSYHFTRISE